MNRQTWVRGLVTLALLGSVAQPARADVTSDRAAAILIFPRISASEGERAVDTIIQISNTTLDPQVLHCFYVNATGHCSGSNNACNAVTNPCPADQGICTPGWVETDFFVYVTPRQPLAWRATVGMADALVPLDGDFRTGPAGDSNRGTRVPPIAELNFQGELKCIVVDADGRPVPRNAVKGEASIVATLPGGVTDVAKYNAVGIEAFEADANENRVLVLGGGSNEYAGCPSTLIVDHFFDFAEAIVGPASFQSELTLIPCTQDFLNQIPGSTTVQYLVFNEFEQRFSTSTPIDCYFERPLSLIDTSNQRRSIFSAFVAGTVSGQTRIRGVSQGLVGVLLTRHGPSTAAFNLHTQGDRPQSDLITLP